MSLGKSLVPVELTSTSMRPSVSTAAETTACAPATCAMSPSARAIRASGKCAASAAIARSPRSRLRPLTTTASAPAASIASAHALPMPAVPPVISTVFPCSGSINGCFASGRRRGRIVRPRLCNEALRRQHFVGRFIRKAERLCDCPIGDMAAMHIEASAQIDIFAQRRAPALVGERQDE